MDPALRALNRFGLGARIGERASLDDPRGWLHRQLESADARLDDARLPTAADAGDALRTVRGSRNERDPDKRREARQPLQRILAREVRATLTRRVTTDAPFVERLVAFWSNHLCVSVAAKPPVVALAGLYEREAIRPHVLGRFQDLVLASARHPAMLSYLDNAQSVGADSRGAHMVARRGRELGLNENYARELMELHTVGVDGGYTQADVIQMARLLTGWSVGGLGPREGGPLVYRFRALLHEPGPKTLMGVTYAQGGEAEGERAIRDLCARPSTARFVSTKLVRHFVADEPPDGAVDRIAGIFRDTGGDLHAMASALIDLDAAWDPTNRKLRTPQDWLVAVMRALHAREVPPAVGAVLRALDQPLWAPKAPKGYTDLVRDWADPDSLINRAEVARTVAKRVTRPGVDPRRLLDVVDVPDGDPLRTLLADRSIQTDERVALALGGPAFQWR